MTGPVLRRPMARLRAGGTLPGGTVPVAVGLVVLGATAYGFLVLAARALGPARYAPLSVLWALVFLVGPGVFVPLEQELARAVSAHRATGTGSSSAVRKLSAVGAVMAGVLLVATFGSAGWLLSRLFDDQPLLLVGLVLSLVGYFAEHLVRGVLAGHGEFGAYGLILGAEGAVRLAGCLALVVGGVASPGPYGVVLGGAPILAAAIGARGHRLLLPRPGESASRASDERPGVPGLTAALGWLLAGSLFAQLLVNGAPVVVKLLAEAGDAATVGRFVAGLIVARVPLFLFASVQAAALPRLSHLVAAGLHDELRAAVRRLLVAVGALGVAGTIGAGLVGPAVVQVVFGSAFRLGRGDLAYLAAASGFYMLAMTVAQALIALRAQAQVAVSWLAGFGAFVVVVLLSSGLLLRAERGLLAGAMVAFAVMAVWLRPALKGNAYPALPTV